MRVAFDIDGVIADFVRSFTKIPWNIFGDHTFVPWTTPEQEQWGFPPHFQYERTWEYVKAQYNWWMTLKPLINNYEIAMLNNAIDNHDVYFITSRPRTKGFSAETQSKLWLSSIGVISEHASVIATQAGKKGVLCKALDIDVAIDDRVGGVQEIMEQGINCFTRRWKYNDNIKGFKYVNGLAEFLVHPDVCIGEINVRK